MTYWIPPKKPDGSHLMLGPSRHHGSCRLTKTSDIVPRHAFLMMASDYVLPPIKVLLWQGPLQKGIGSAQHSTRLCLLLWQWQQTFQWRKIIVSCICKPDYPKLNIWRVNNIRICLINRFIYFSNALFQSRQMSQHPTFTNPAARATPSSLKMQRQARINSQKFPPFHSTLTSNI